MAPPTCTSDGVATTDVTVTLAGFCTVAGPGEAGPAETGVAAFASVPPTEAANVSEPLPDTSYVQVKTCCAPPPSSTLPEGGDAASVAAAVPVACTAGAAGDVSCSEAPPVFVAVSFTWTCCSPADTVAGNAPSERLNAAGACTVTVPVCAGEGDNVAPVFASVADAGTCQKMVPLPETEYVQLNCVELPECRTSGVKGVALPAAAAVPVVTATGVPTLCRVMSAPPGLLAVSFTVTCCRPADTCKGAADAAIESCPGNCAWTPGLATAPVDSAWVASLPSVPCADDASTSCPAELCEVVQMQDAASPA